MTVTRTATDLRAWARIDLQALRDNLARARPSQHPASLIVVVKANAYGHGMLPVAGALQAQLRPRDCFGVATLEEGLALRAAGFPQDIVLLEGVVTPEELDQALAASLQLVLHSTYQIEALLRRLERGTSVQPQVLWLKADTGMHRLGLAQDEFVQAWHALHAHPAVAAVRVVTHFACADDPSSAMTVRQMQALDAMLIATGIDNCERSVAASAAIQQWPQTHFQWLRPGIMLYGGAAIAAENGEDRGLCPVMTLHSRIMAIKQVQAGETLGYGASYRCERDMRIGIVSIGYGDGYPRRAPAGTPVLVHSRTRPGLAPVRAGLCGRVSMDMLIIDLTDAPLIEIGDDVVLWGEGLPADEIARHCGTIAYELFCQVTPRVQFVYV